MRRAGALALAAFGVTVGVASGVAIGGIPGCTTRVGADGALAWLLEQQRADGAYTSPDYGVLRPGHSTTALAALALAELWPRTSAQQRALHASLDWLARDGLAPATGPVDYPCYTAALFATAVVAARRTDAPALLAPAIALLRARQLGPARGWTTADPEFGGFGFGVADGPRPAEGDVASLSVTAWAVTALHASGLPTDDPALAAARRFVLACQVHDPSDPARHGGFLHTPRSGAWQSKAGIGTTGPRPYASTTADGLRALRVLGERNRAADAKAWLLRHLRPPAVAGFDPSDLRAQPYEPALRLYTAAVAAPQLRATPELVVAWRAALAGQQRADGAVVGWSPLLKEDDPLVATCLALLAWSALR